MIRMRWNVATRKKLDLQLTRGGFCMQQILVCILLEIKYKSSSKGSDVILRTQKFKRVFSL